MSRYRTEPSWTTHYDRRYSRYSTSRPGYTHPPQPPRNNHPPDQPFANGELLRMVFTLTLGFIVVVLNMVEILLLRRLTRKLKVYEFFIFSMSISDLLFGLSSSLVLIIFFASPNSKGSSTITDITYTLYFLFIVSSILHLIGIASDRLFAVHKPVLHNVKVTRRKVVRFIAMIWTVSILSAAILYASNNLSTAFQQEKVTYEEVNETVTTAIPYSITTNQNTFVGAQRLYRPSRPDGKKRPSRHAPRPGSGTRRPQTGLPTPSRPFHSTTYHPRSTQTSKQPQTTRESPPTPPNRIKRVQYVGVFQESMQTALAYFIIFADVVLVTIYTLVIFSVVRHHRNNSSVTINNGSINSCLLYTSPSPRDS